MSSKEILNSFTTNLFWDVDLQDIDMEKYPSFIIPRVLEYGGWEDWKKIVDYYGIQRIAEICKQLRTLDPVCLSYICTISHTHKQEYRCWHTRQSCPTLWNS